MVVMGWRRSVEQKYADYKVAKRERARQTPRKRRTHVQKWDPAKPKSTGIPRHVGPIPPPILNEKDVVKAEIRHALRASKKGAKKGSQHGVKFAYKAGRRFIPYVGWALLAWDVYELYKWLTKEETTALGTSYSVNLFTAVPSSDNIVGYAHGVNMWKTMG